jgi:hypothetical protein
MHATAIALLLLVPRALPSPAPDNPFCLLIMDAESLVCTPCLDPLLRLCRALPAFIQEKCVLGILVPGGSAQTSDDSPHIRIIRKKLSGLMQANDLRFPVLVDSSRVFGDLTARGPAAVLFDRDRRFIKRYALPLSSRQEEELLGFLLK